MLNPSFAVVLSMLLQSGGPDDIVALKGRAQEGGYQGGVQLGVAYASGRGVPADDAEAVTWFRKAARRATPPGNIR